jgi:hypothetical protein
MSERIPLDGAGNVRFTDDPLTDDTGQSVIGYLQIIDVGAYERYDFCGDANHPYPSVDFNHDCIVDIYDFAEFCSHWLENTIPE